MIAASRDPMIVGSRDLQSRIHQVSKPALRARCARSTFFRALSGNRSTRASALELLTIARDLFGQHVVGIEIAGEVHFAPDALDSLRALEAENARLQAELTSLRQRFFRQLVAEGRLALPSHQN